MSHEVLILQISEDMKSLWPVGWYSQKLNEMCSPYPFNRDIGKKNANNAKHCTFLVEVHSVGKWPKGKIWTTLEASKWRRLQIKSITHHNLFNCNQYPEKLGCAQKAYIDICFSSHPNLCLFEYFDTLTDSVLLYLGQALKNRHILVVWKQQFDFLIDVSETLSYTL